MTIDLAAFGYAAAVAAGGVLGYVKSNSIPSLGAGILFGGLLGYGAFQTSSEPPSYAVFTGTSAVLAGVMGYRYYSTGKMMPAGGIALMSALMVIRTIVNRYTQPALKVE